MIGKTILHYEILEKLGEGGMGVVYKAEDIKLRRDVAIKFLPSRIAANDKERERFKIEAQAAAALNHPNIATIYAIEESDDEMFIVMEFIDGQELKGRIDSGPLTVDESINIAIQIADGLQVAHKKGIVHRDIKSSNIMITDDGKVKIMDFGLAKVSGGADITKAGTTLGTVAYMSPEQVHSSEVDHRSDIWSVGVVLFEMLAGQKPFQADYEQAVIYMIVNEDPHSITDRNPDVPENLAKIVERCLQKEVTNRYQKITDLMADLNSVISQLKDPHSNILHEINKQGCSIAILPFKDLSPEGDQEYFCEGIADEIINALVKVKAIRVASRKSAFQFSTAEGDIRDIGKRLSVSNVLEGSVRKAADRLRVVVQLVSVRDDQQLWSEKYDRVLEDVFAVQDEIAENVVEALKITLTPDERQAIQKVPTQNIQAYDYYLRGRYFIYLWGKKNLELSIEMFSKAINIDKDYALAYAGIADAETLFYELFGKKHSHLERALAASKKAVDLDPKLAEAHSSRGVALAWDSKYEEAESEFELATKLNWQLFEAHYFWARASFVQGKLEDSVKHYENACKVRPEDYQAPTLLSTVYTSLNREQDAAECRRHAFDVIKMHLNIHPDDVRALYFGAGMLVQMGKVKEGLDWLDQVLKMDPDDPDTLYNVACVYSNAGQIDAAMDCLEKTLRMGMSKSKEWVAHDSDLDPLRENDRFKSFVKQLK